MVKYKASIFSPVYLLLPKKKHYQRRRINGSADIKHACIKDLSMFNLLEEFYLCIFQSTKPSTINLALLKKQSVVGESESGERKVA